MKKPRPKIKKVDTSSLSEKQAKEFAKKVKETVSWHQLTLFELL